MGTVCFSDVPQIKYPSTHKKKDEVRPPQKYPIPDDKDKYVDEIQMDSMRLYKVTEEEMNSRLHKNVVALIWRQKKYNMDQIGRGSGLLISKNLVLTSAHNFYNNLERVEISSVEIYPGQYGPLLRPYKVDQVYIPNEYHELKKTKHEAYFDYALVKLTESVDGSDFISLKPDVINKRQTLSIFGYPAIKYENTNKRQNIQSVTQWGLMKKDAIIEISKNGLQILHKVSTLAAQSGSAIIEVQDQQLFVVGIHKGAKTRRLTNGDQLKYNVGIRLTKELIGKLWQAGKSMGADMFNKNSEHSAIAMPREEGWLYKGRQHYMQDQYHQAAECLLKAIQANKSNSLAHLLIGNCYMKNGNKEKAIKYYQKAIQIKPNYAEAHYNLGYTFLQLKDYDEAMKKFKEAIKIKKDYFEAYFNIGRMYQNQKKSAEAVQYFQKAVGIKRNDFQTWISLANLHKKTEQYQKALACFKNAIQLDENSAEAYNGQGDVYQKMKEYDEAIRCYTKTIQIQPNFVNAYYSLANVYANVNRTLEAIDILKKAVAINSTNEVAHNNLGKYLLYVNQELEAIEYFKRAIILKADYGAPYYNLGKANQKLGNLPVAIYYYELYAQMNPKEQQVKRKLQELKHDP